MAVPEQTPYIEHTGNGVTTSFSLGFQCESKDHLIVLVDEIEPPIETWNLIDENVAFTAAPTSGQKITLQRNTPFGRATNYQSFNNSFRPQAVNGDFDRVWWKIQELGVRDWLLDLKIQKFRDDVNLTALENTLIQAQELRDSTAVLADEVLGNTNQSQTLLANTTEQANAAALSATSANSSKDLAKQYADNIDASLTAIAGGHKAYATLAAALANTSTFPMNSIIEITNDGANNGAYQWNGGDLTKSAYDPLTQAKADATTKANAAEANAKTYTNTEIAEKFGSIVAGTTLNTLVDAGTWGISAPAVFADSRNVELGYPAELSSSSAVLTVAQTITNYAVQELTHGTKKYKRTLHRSTGAVFENWKVLGVDDYAKKGVVVNLTDLNTYTEEGIFACTSAVMRSGLEAGDLNYPTFFESDGGGILIVSKSGVYPYQVFISTRQRKIAVRQGVSSTSYSPWVDMLVGKTFLAFGSSSFANMAAKIRTMIESFSATYISDAVAGQILESMQAHQGSNPVSITFNDGVTALNNVASAVTVTQKDNFGSLTVRGSSIVTLSNGLKGRLDLNANTFTASNATEVYIVESEEFKVDFGYSQYRNNAVHLINIGKNNISGGYSAQVVFDNTVKMVEYIESVNNDKFVVAGHYVNRGSSQDQKDAVLQVNALLKRKYGVKYFDMQDYLMSDQIWIDLNISPTQDDLDKQAEGQLAVSLSRDTGHVSASVDTLMVDRLKQKLQYLSYL